MGIAQRLGHLQEVARTVSEMAPGVLGVEKDLVLVPTLHDTPNELGMPFGVADWKKGECEAIPGQTMPSMTVVERDYPNLYRKFTSLGPLLDKQGNGGKGMSWDTKHEVEFLGKLNHTVHEEGVSQGRPAISTAIDAAEVILHLAPETNGHVAVKAWESLGTFTGREHTHLAVGKEHEAIRFRDIQAQPRKIISSPIWSGLEDDNVSYNAGYTNVHELIPWRTVTGRQQFYQDHEWMIDFGEAFMGYRPPVNTRTVEPLLNQRPNGNKEIVLNWITPHQKWGIHSTYSDNLIMQTLSRGGPIVWISEDDARSGRHRRQRLDRAVQRQRCDRRACGGQPARDAGHGDDVPRPGTHHQRAGLGDFRHPRRHPQLGDPHRAQAHPHDRWLRAAGLRLQLLRHLRNQPR